MNINTNKTLCILYSGGLDSRVSYEYAKTFDFDKITCLNIQIGQPYDIAEKESLNRTINSLPIKERNNFITLDLPVLRNEKYLYYSPDKDKCVIPGRNAMLLSIAANFGDIIWLNVTGHIFPYMPDTLPEFLLSSTSYLSYSHDTSKKVISPLSGMTKTEIIRKGLYLGLTPNQLLETYSCYSVITNNNNNNTYIPCGNCDSCFFRSIGFINNDIHEEYQENPLISDYSKVVKNNIDKYTEKQIYDIKDAYNKVGLEF